MADISASKRGPTVIVEDELVTAIRRRIEKPDARIDLLSARVPPLFVTATIEELDAAEVELGFALPMLIRRLYSEVGNGGFGPGAGLLGVKGGYADLDGRTLSDSYLALRTQGWPQGVLPLCEPGGGARSCADMRASGERVLTVDAGEITRTSHNLFSWLHAWVSGVDMEAEIFEVKCGTIVNPFTKKPHQIKQRGKARGVLLESFRE
jgi:hypothetical protein